MKRAAAWASVFCAMSISWPSQAAGLRVSPLRLDVSARQPAAELQLQNLTDAPLPVEITVMRWQQQDGEDVYTPSDDLFFAPPIIRIAPGASQSVRFLLTTRALEQTEGSYRIYVEELPATDAGNRSTAMSFRMRFGVPLFVAAQAPAPPVLELRSARREGDNLRLVLHNAGGTHLRVNQLLVLAQDSAPADNIDTAIAQAHRSSTGSNYLLPGSSQEWLLNVGSDAASSLLLTTDYYGRSEQSAYQGDGRYWLPLP